MRIFAKTYTFPPVPFDAGVSLGAALMVSFQLNQIISPQQRLEHAYYAPQASSQETETAIQSSGLIVHRFEETELLDQVAHYLANGKLVGWSQGNAEVGQRALGARSILCDPRERKNLVRVNTIKGREVWRPLAPSILEEYAEDMFGSNLPNAADFMLAACTVRAHMQKELPLAGEPMVYSPADAISTFCRSGLDILVIDNYVLQKQIDIQ